MYEYDRIRQRDYLWFCSLHVFFLPVCEKFHVRLTKLMQFIIIKHCDLYKSSIIFHLKFDSVALFRTLE